MIDGRRLPFLVDETADAALSCSVVVDIGKWDEIRAIAADASRGPRPGGGSQCRIPIRYGRALRGEA